MSVKAALHELVDRLGEEQAAEAYAYLSLVIANDGPARDNRERVGRPATMTGRDFFSAPHKDLVALAGEQGVEPVTDFDALLGDFWPEVETADEFIAAVREWRREGGRA